ncbi:hypothetical protein HAX54_031252 [Datura stramonium]|uniref:Uncharacterized protein n=1 Tax=Datura stramonium TaxID=4076 RepID=A0ABS8V9X3_DATST|nr:hypothetical protein [Datura stramonium]
MSLIEVGVMQAHLCYGLHDALARSKHGEAQCAKGSGALSNTRHSLVQMARSQIPVLLGIEVAKPKSNPRHGGPRPLFNLPLWEGLTEE